MTKQIAPALRSVSFLLILFLFIGCSSKEELTQELVDLASSREGLNPQAAERLIEKGADPNVMINGVPLLMHAIASRSNPLVEF